VKAGKQALIYLPITKGWQICQVTISKGEAKETQKSMRCCRKIKSLSIFWV